MAVDTLEWFKAPKNRHSTKIAHGLTKAIPARIPELDGLRGLAIVTVMLFHYMSDAPGYAVFGLAYKFRQLFRLGWSGVDLFFVLSGFLIGGILLDNRKSASYFKTFYARRAFRILPIYFLWLVLYVVVAEILLKWPLQALPVYPEALKMIPQYFLFLPSLMIGFARVSLGLYWLGHLWSLAVEEQFYLVAAPVVRFSSDRGLLISLLATILLSPLIRILIHTYCTANPGIFYALSFGRADALAMGILVAMARRNANIWQWISNHKRHLYAILAFLTVLMGILDKWFHDGNTLFAAAFTLQWIAIFYSVLLVTILADVTGALAGFFRWSFLREMGRISYCAYLIHFAVSALLHAIILKQRPTLYTMAEVSVAAGAFLLTIGLAELSMKYFEGPMLRLGHRFRYSPASVA